ncbi:F-box protein At3g07870-like [Cornus florida]|uniref:F-box protein At3g07870-like n=1 Tax=Cornus florida TaxID=4283 RepID=UPI00289B6EC4|nr:F-box protein At3g07870-like [Cornus florida]
MAWYALLMIYGSFRIEVYICGTPLLGKLLYFQDLASPSVHTASLIVFLDSDSIPQGMTIRLLELFIFLVALRFDIFSLKEGVWRNISVPSLVPRIGFDPFHAYLNGAIHWVSGGDDHRLYIVLFNLGTEVFSEMELPTSLPHSLSCAVFQDSLCAFHIDSYECKVSVWVMKEYGVVESWTNLFNIDYSRGFDLREVGPLSNWFNLDSSIPSGHNVRVIGLRRNGEVVLVKDGWMISVDIKARTFEYLGFRGYDAALSVNTYTESLVLIDKANGLQEG